MKTILKKVQYYFRKPHDAPKAFLPVVIVDNKNNIVASNISLPIYNFNELEKISKDIKTISINGTIYYAMNEINYRSLSKDLRRYEIIPQNHAFAEYYNQLNQEYESKLYYDQLTKLNTFEGLRKKLDANKKSDIPYTVMLADLDDFKKINDTFGHDAGDDALCLVATILQSAFRPSDVCRYHIGKSDEFLIVVQMEDQDEILNRICKIQREISKLYSIDDITVPLGITFGISTCNHLEQLNEAIKQADSSLVQAKYENPNIKGGIAQYNRNLTLKL